MVPGTAAGAEARQRAAGEVTGSFPWPARLDETGRPASVAAIAPPTDELGAGLLRAGDAPALVVFGAKRSTAGRVLGDERVANRKAH